MKALLVARRALAGVKRESNRFIVAVAATTSYSTRKPLRRGLVVAFSVLILIWVLSWIAARALIITVPLEQADVIIVLSGSATFVERTHVAAQLYAAGAGQRVLLTNDNRQGGWLSSEQRNPFFYERARWELERLGVPRSKIEVLEPQVDSTQDEALAVRRYAETKKLRALLIVTSAYHSRRALGTFQRVLGGQFKVGIVSPSPGWQTPAPASWWLSAAGWRTVPNEYLKIGYYWLRF